MATEIKGKLQGGNKDSVEHIFQSLTKYYLYTMNEASLGLYSAQFISKKMTKEMFESEEQVAKEKVLESLNKYNNLARIMDKESKELAELKDQWASKMSENMNALMK